MVDQLVESASAIFAGNVEAQSQGLPDLACKKGCATCCTIGVAATAPEILMITKYLPQHADAATIQRIASAYLATRGLDGSERMALGEICPFVDGGVCVIYAVRPLACRGHASYDEGACIEALAGRDRHVPISSPHIMVRNFVQNAMQSSLRDVGLAWAAYELNEAVQIALTFSNTERDWRAGRDVFAEALLDDVSLEEIASAFDAIKQQIQQGRRMVTMR
jgi:Fe-S-cluster containining protein